MEIAKTRWRAEQQGSDTQGSRVVDQVKTPDLTTATSAASKTDEALVAAAKTGDELAFETLVKRYHSRIFAIALRYTRIHEDAEDVVQQTFQKVFVHLHRFQGKSSFSTWVTRIVINESLMFLRRVRAAREIPLDGARREDANSGEQELVDSSPDPEMTCLQQESMHILFSAVAQLRPALRVAMELKELGELSGMDTARHMGVSVGTVKTRVFQGRRKLRKMLRHRMVSLHISGRTSLGITDNRHRVPRNRTKRAA